MRAFLALPAPEDWMAPLLTAQTQLPGGRPVPEDDLHLTLAFLDDQPGAVLEDLADDMGARPLPAVRLAPLSYVLLGARRARAVALDVAPDAGLTRLRDLMRGAARRVGIALPRSRFRPHITLTRYGATAPADMSRLPGLLGRLMPSDCAPTMGRSLCLWTSTLTADGPHYQAICCCPLPAYDRPEAQC